MTDPSDQVKGALLDSAVELALRRSQSDHVLLTEPVLRHYYERTPAQDLVGKDPIALYAAAMRHVRLAQRRDPDECLVRIYNPNSDEDGWSAQHTVIDIVDQDMPFLVDSVLALFERLDHYVHVLVHPMFEAHRDRTGELVELTAPTADADSLESLLHVEIDALSGSEQIAQLESDLRSVLLDVRSAVQDWAPMRDRALELATELDGWVAEVESGQPVRFQSEIGSDPQDVAQLLRWMESGSFTFIGYREYDFEDDGDRTRVVSRPGTGLGVLRQGQPSERDLSVAHRETLEQARRPVVLNLTKTNRLSTVHRSVPLDYVGIKKIDEEGRVVGERRFLGLFTSRVYSGQVQDIPCIEAKVQAVADRSGFHSTSHDYNRLLNTLQTYPRDELFQITVDELETMVLAILDLRDRRQVSLLLRHDRYGRFLSCLVFVPRDRHNTDVRIKIQNTLMEVYRGTSVRYSTEISDEPLARLHLVIYTEPLTDFELPDTAAVEARLVQITRTWDDYLRSSLLESHGEERGLELLARYSGAFDAGYREAVLAESAIYDIDRLEALGVDEVDVFLHHPLEADRFELRCKIYRAGTPIVLSELIPVLHDLGAVVIDERPHKVTPIGQPTRYIYDLGLSLPRELDRDDRLRIRDALLAVWDGRCESDGLAQLVVHAGLQWRQVTVLRAYSRYLIQIGSSFSLGYIFETLNGHPKIAGRLIKLFDTRFDPDSNLQTESDMAEAEVGEEIAAAIDRVASLDADRILRSFWSLIRATLRTNYWQGDAESSHALAFKLDPARIEDIPKPVPSAEIFVYSPRTEGVHLRSGRVARGGLRWSDRMEDYRTEILGLMKAQTVKNSVIVPVGAKGGFVVRRQATVSRDDFKDEVLACYSIFIGALLDLTDNVVDDVVVPPQRVRRHDSDDPYLVVAADKGTATFSDTANSIAVDRGFWLGDAFASGGSAGYDHKALAITARGAWVSVERHFRELGLNAATTPFTAVGIGDMSGDVFGNGMLRSDKTCLVAAFDHRHIFLDPNPEPAGTYLERLRLFSLPRSSWADYDESLLSEGGGVYDRASKSISISDQARECLDIDATITELTPDQLIRAILAADVDLLWNGGIGTYIKATSETNAEVGDRNNDGVRIDAAQVGAKVIGEGGNLGVSQLGRIEYAARGGYVNTDAIDNSGGVDCSDNEVNLKILLAIAERNGDLTRKQRDQLLEAMADDVVEQVLANNYAQTATLSVAVAEAPGMVQVHGQTMRWLEESAGLDREIEQLPSTAELGQRQSDHRGLTRPELAVLLAYAKNSVTKSLVEADIARSSAFDDLLVDYFPRQIVTQFPELVEQHPLRQELVAMLLSNAVVNNGGISMIHRLMQETSATVADICIAHFAAWEVFDLSSALSAIQGLDGNACSGVQTQLTLEVMRIGERATRWLLRNEPQPIDIELVSANYREAIESLSAASIEAGRSDEEMRAIDHYCTNGVPPTLAAMVANFGTAFGFLDLVNAFHQGPESATPTRADLRLLSELHLEVSDRLDLARLRRWIFGLQRGDQWATMARGALRDQYFREHAELTVAVFGAATAPRDMGLEAGERVQKWLDDHAVAVQRCKRTFDEISASNPEDHDLAHASVAVRALTQLRRSS